MMDLVYILGKGSKWNNNELRYSLRSAIKNFKFDKVFIIGEKPDWLENVIHIPATDHFINKLQNAAVKYLIACNDERISENFVLMNDDFFFLKHINDIPFYSRGKVSDVLKLHRSKAGYYYNAIRHTKQKLGLDMLESDVIDFEVHAPIIFNKVKLKEIIESVKDGTICLFRTYYSNIVGVQYNIIKDFKITSLKDFDKELDKEREFMSISDTMVGYDRFRAWIQGTFSYVSKYENDEGQGIHSQPGVSQEFMSYHASQDFSYRGKQFRKGQLIDMRTMKLMKPNKSLKHLWILK